MAILEQKVPTLGESITEVTIGSWNKKTGDSIKSEEVLGVMESDKASFDIIAEQAGILEIVAEAGTTIPVGAVIFKINVEGNTTPTPATAVPATPVTKTENTMATSVTPKTSSQVVEMRVKALGESITEVTIGEWTKKEGDVVKLDEIIGVLESDKASFDIPAEQAGVLRIVAAAGDVLKIGDLICKIEANGDLNASISSNTVVSDAKTEPTTQPLQNNQDSYAKGSPSISADKILAEKGISTTNVTGTGVGGRITKEDALNAKVETKTDIKTETPVQTPQTQQKVDAQLKIAGSRTERREKMTTLRKTIAKRLVAVKNETAMLTTFNEVNMKPIMDLRAKYKDRFKEKYEVGLGFMSFFVKACCQALLDFPVVNAYMDGDEVVFNDFCDISVAVSTGKGLVVPVIRNAEELSFAGVEKEIIRLAGRARDGKLTIPEMTGGTFTITNGGIFGSMLSTPIINAPQSAILGMHNIVERPMAVNGEVKILPIMYVALSYDHRTIDGKDSVSFLVRVKQLLEEPERLLFGV
jgi:2-oxoglutarate dehydrogenase E2 component (dihydrolipoamide succinyltransferase)